MSRLNDNNSTSAVKKRRSPIRAVAFATALAAVVVPGIGTQGVANAQVPPNDGTEVPAPSTVASTVPTTTTPAEPSTTTATTSPATTAPPSTTAPTTEPLPTTIPLKAAEQQTALAAAPFKQPCTKNPITPDRFLPELPPIDIDLDKTVRKRRDNVAVLLGGMAKTNGVVRTGGYRYKYRWYECFDTTSDSFIWNVSLSKPTKFVVRLNMTSAPGDLLRLDVLGTNNRLMIQPSTVTRSWDLLEPGTITIPAGKHRLRLKKQRAAPEREGGRGAGFKSVELIAEKDYPAYLKRVERFRANTDILRGKKGYMVQWGGWSYPRVGPRPDPQTVWNQFNVEKFANEMKRADVDYVIWSVTWVDYLFPGPIKAIDKITGPNYDRTADRDLLAEVGRALQRRGIDMMVYYHLGHGSEKGWFEYQDWPTDTFLLNGTGDRSTFFKNWKSVITEVGNRYGSLIKGFLFDDGLTYYPANFEELGAIARSGYSQRLISYNAFQQARYTDFQDVNFGEFNCTAYRVDWRGRYVEGPHKGLLSHCMIRAHNDWGSWSIHREKPGFVEEPQHYYNLYRVGADQGAHTISHMMFNGPTFIDRKRDPASPKEEGPPGNDADNTRIGGQLPGVKVFDIEATKDGTLMGLSDGNAFGTYNPANDRWSSSGRVSRISMQSKDAGYGIEERIDDRCRPACVSRALLQYKKVDGRATWVRQLSNVEIKTVAVSPDNSLFGITDDNKIKRLVRDYFIELPGTWTDVTVGKNARDLWALDAKGKPSHWDGKKWTAQRTHLSFTKLEAGNDGSLLGIIKDGRLARLEKGTWVQYRPFGKVTDVSVVSYDDFWVISEENGWIGHNNNGKLEAARHTTR